MEWAERTQDGSWIQVEPPLEIPSASAVLEQSCVVSGKTARRARDCVATNSLAREVIKARQTLVTQQRDGLRPGRELLGDARGTTGAGKHRHFWLAREVGAGNAEVLAAMKGLEKQVWVLWPRSAASSRKIGAATAAPSATRQKRKCPHRTGE